MSTYPEHIAAAIKARVPVTTGQMTGRLTPGGTYIITSTALVNDDDEPRDLVAITRLDEVIALWPTANLEPAKAALA